ncbi:MAG: Hpt domain-containing protein [Kangiellaceae bacterium]|nr:Hpt domain-containing protein [Kangiellaceae bacterium]MCW8998295.1 Hpt domain-containing protein [Kangiellaceae bacterium]MCW9016100.1 Hpt domain-containing protein [Kangiellaceae bacterium]
MTDVLDSTIISELQEIMGEDLGMLLETYVEDTQQKIEQLKSEIKEKNTDSIRRTAHSIKGSSKNVGATELADWCQQMETGAREENLQDVDIQLANIESSFQNVCDAIQSLT